MIKNIIFDFDGVLVDSEILARKAFSQYLNSKNHKFSEEEFSLAYSGNKLVEVIKKLSIRFGIQNEDVFFKEVMALSRSIYMNELQPVIGVKKFLNSVNQNKLIGSNRDKHSLIQGLKLTKLKTYFEENNIFSFDMVSQPKPDPEIFLKALEDSKIHSNETIVIEDSVIGVEAAVKAQIKVIAITAGGHWINRSDNILKDAGAYFVASTFEQVIKVIEKL
tara:strand:- start:9098 stop:9757 length:660 start_codon:yes stop_codon:yes gene_type:complete